MPFRWTNQIINELKARNTYYEVNPHASVLERESAEAFIKHFRYFWHEVKQVGSSEAEMNALLNEVYGAQIAALGDFNPEGNRRQQEEAQTQKGRQFINERITIPNDYYDNDRRRSILERLLNIGFAAMTEYTIGTPGFPDTLRIRARDYKFFSHTINLDISPEGKVPIAFRGEQRTFERVLSQGGARRKVEIGLEHTKAPWHPFSTQLTNRSGRGDQMYFRKASGDNCLYTVVSIADKASLALRFPLIDDSNIYNLPALADGNPKPINEWTAQESTDAQTSGVRLVEARVQLDGGSTRTHSFLCTETYLYAFRVSGRVVHTEYELDQNGGGGLQQCKERGARFVPIENFLFGVKVHRVHTGPTHDYRIYAFVQECKYFVDGSWHDIANLSAPGSLTRFLNYHFSNPLLSLTDEQITSLTGQIEEILRRFKVSRDATTGQYIIDRSAPLLGEAMTETTIEGERLAGLTITRWEIPLDSAPLVASSLSVKTDALSSVFPRLSSELTYSLADEPILINGMKVIFDQTVPVYPVTLVRKDAPKKVKESNHG